MKRWFFTLLFGLACLGHWTLAGEPRAPAKSDSRSRSGRCSSQTCFPCHGGKKTSGGLKVDSRESLIKGGDSGPAIVPGHPEQSLLVRRCGTPTNRSRCRPSKRLPEETLAAFTRWVKEGAAMARGIVAIRSENGLHVASGTGRSSRSGPIDPPPDPTGWALHPIDRFIAARHRAAGVRPVAPADRRTLLRRVTFDLIGLPPTPEEIADFLGDQRPDAFARVVERLLASPHYGERWGGTGWTWRAMPTPPETTPTTRFPRRPAIATTSSTHSTPTSRSTQFVREQLAGDILARAGPRGPGGREDRRHRVSRPLAPLRHGALRALAPHARGRHRDDRPRLPRPDAPLRPLPRPQVRPGHPARLLLALRHLRQHEVPLRRLGGILLQEIPRG